MFSNVARAVQLCAALQLLPFAHGANPLVPGVGMADTNVHFFDGKFAIFATHDFSINNTVRFRRYVTLLHHSAAYAYLPTTYPPGPQHDAAPF